MVRVSIVLWSGSQEGLHTRVNCVPVPQHLRGSNQSLRSNTLALMDLTEILHFPPMPPCDIAAEAVAVGAPEVAEAMPLMVMVMDMEP